jgi:hypothetical protein
VVDEVEVEDEVVVLVVALNLPLLSSSRRPRARRIMWSCRSQGQGQSEEKRREEERNNNNKRTNDGSVPPPSRALLAIKGKQVQLIIALTSEAHSPLSRHTKAIIR